MSTRVVITGLGVVSPIGIGVPQFWKAALEGRSGISAIPSFAPFPLEGYRSRIAGRIVNFSPDHYLPAGQGDRVDRYAQFALVAAKEALADADFKMEREDPHRVGVIVGAGMGGMVMGEREITQLYEQKRPHRVHPNFIPVITLNSASGIVAMAYGAKGPNLTISTACSSSAHALGQAMHAIRAGTADAVIVVGADASITPLVFAGFCSLRALSTKYNDAPEKASRPFDRGRDGFVMGEGAGALILESLAHAKKRKARMYAEVAGYAATSEAHHMVIPREDGEEVATTMKLALKDAGVTAAQVDYINAHATSNHGRRRGRGEGYSLGIQVTRGQARRERDQVTGGPYTRRGRIAGRSGLRPHAHERAGSSHAQSGRSRPGVRTGWPVQGPANAEGEGGADQRIWIRQQQRGRRVKSSLLLTPVRRNSIAGRRTR
ncbi:MAG: beta-ketoacyl synthase N-terminal-like domain-containing protein [Nitrospira sp.]